MNHHDTSLAAWCRALSLAERLRLPSDPSAVAAADVERATERLGRWRDAFASPRLFTDYLASIGVSEEMLLRVLVEPARNLAARCAEVQFGWIEDLDAALGNQNAPLQRRTADPTEGLLTLVAPLIDWGITQLCKRVEPLNVDLDHLLEPLVLTLHMRLLTLVERPLILEMNAARLGGELDGASSHERFDSFVAQLGDQTRRIELLIEYPVLARLAITYVRQWADNAAEVMERALRDHAELEAAFGTLGALVAVRAPDSDRHHGGRHVLFLEYETGTRLVYKPRSLAVDAALQTLVSWINSTSESLQLLTLTVVDRCDYGWMEYVEGGAMGDPGDVAAFHERLGAWLAVSYVLAGTDLHYENVLAAGPHPVPIDLEMMLHPHVFTAPNGSIDDTASNTINDSVVGIGLLPAPAYDPRAGALVDLSGMGDAFRNVTLRGSVVVRPATDEMHVGHGDLKLDSAGNRPHLGNGSIDVRAHVAEIEHGFVATYRLFEQHGAGLLDENGLLTAFANTQVRFIVRPTWYYAALLRSGRHPERLVDGLLRDRGWAPLWDTLENEPWRTPFVSHERAQLSIDDVPYFAATASGGDGTTSAGSTIPAVVVRSGVEAMEDRISRLGDQDLDTQLWLTRATLLTKSYGPPVVGRPVAVTSPLDAAKMVGDRLSELAIRDGGQVTWIGLGLMGSNSTIDDVYQPQVAGSDLYDGLPGIILFLATLAHVTGEGKYRALANEAMATLDRRDLVNAHGIGAFSGAAGLIYLRARLWSLWKSPTLLDQAIEDAVSLERSAGDDEVLDVISGMAGVIPCLLALATCTSNRAVLDIARNCGDHLISCAPTWSGLPTRRGLSHGLSGVVLALARLARHAGDERYARAARAAYDQERQCIRETGAWSDYDASGGSEQVSWCHGAPGIALSRMELWRLTQDEEHGDSACEALARVAAANQPTSHGLCHGALGNLDVFITACELFGDSRWTHARDALSTRILEEFRTSGWRCSPPRNLESPGLMTGLAGIGYGLLRCASPRLVPSILTLS